MSAREAALLTLAAMDRQKAWSNGHLKKVIREAGLDRRDAALATRLCFGVLQNRMLLDYYLQHYSTMKLGKMESKVREALRIGLYQMLFMTKIPANAAVSEAVELTKKHCRNPRAGGMVNGILRNIARHLDELPTIDRTDRLSYLSLLYSHPRWLVEEWEGRLPGGEAEKLLQWDNGEPPVTVQVNTCRATTAEVIASLEEEGVTVREHPWLPDCLILSATGDLAQRRAYVQGLLYAQDPAARLAVLAAGLTPGQKVLDACAAPGGKSFAAAMVMGDKGEIRACDLHAHKKGLIEAGASRLGLTSITAQVADGKKPRKGWDEAFDTVIADVPCSGLGVIRKKPEIRYKAPEELAGLPRIQGEILDNVARYVRPGGVLLYSTCTLREEENEAVARAFLASHPAFAPEGFTLPGPIGEVPGGQCTLWPQRMETDGFFIARFRKAGEEETAHD
ncbi:MAG: 16S rRNA (cytosine(967)-C(5))-methyltransferase RsmB [Bacillota bacterium]|nr:16S rRNA (cytosine(967)-C(5))-methyltransferase RsmB [Bacillota bacterium]